MTLPYPRQRAIGECVSAWARAGMSLTERTYKGEVALNYVEGPASGPAVLFLHGTIARWQGWKPVLRLAAEHSHVFALDDRGYGESGRSPNGKYSYFDFARDGEMFVRDVIRESTVVIGHSRGAMVALALGAAAPDITRGLILQEPTLRKPGLGDGRSPRAEHLRKTRELLAAGAPVDELAQQLMVTEPDQPEAEARDRAENMSHMDVRAYDAILSGAIREGYDEWALLEELLCPAAFVVGDADGGSTMVDGSLLARARDLIDDSRVITVSGARHRVHLSHPAEFVSACLEFMETLPS